MVYLVINQCPSLLPHLPPSLLTHSLPLYPYIYICNNNSNICVMSSLHNNNSNSNSNDNNNNNNEVEQWRGGVTDGRAVPSRHRWHNNRWRAQNSMAKAAKRYRAATRARRAPLMDMKITRGAHGKRGERRGGIAWRRRRFAARRVAINARRARWRALCAMRENNTAQRALSRIAHSSRKHGENNGGARIAQ